MFRINLPLSPIQDTVLGLAIWGAVDPTNIRVPPAAAPWVISFA
jgi:hypothetical protein